MSLLGYSFGARIATGALHLLGGGQLSGRVTSCHMTGAITRVSSCWRRRCTTTGSARVATTKWPVAHIDYLLNLYDCCDPVLKWYPKLYKGSHAQALGFTGMYTGDLGRRLKRLNSMVFCRRVACGHLLLQECSSGSACSRFSSGIRPDGEPVGEASPSVT